MQTSRRDVKLEKRNRTYPSTKINRGEAQEKTNSPVRRDIKHSERSSSMEERKIPPNRRLCTRLTKRLKLYFAPHLNPYVLGIEAPLQSWEHLNL